ncbi:hypothetical protein EVAR_17654_1 [Eumeta japonica]|uniref:Uncharacterized protein n=1 Tax=Eumeta variegata TaxID=151549 RepID=A0A4C1URP0_EUMVA|nr:hypothetical protein EVAR_17654_1 [Eumeta japonica]
MPKYNSAYHIECSQGARSVGAKCALCLEFKDHKSGALLQFRFASRACPSTARALLISFARPPGLMPIHFTLIAISIKAHAVAGGLEIGTFNTIVRASVHPAQMLFRGIPRTMSGYRVRYIESQSTRIYSFYSFLR